uniref:Uncharacterized protein n=1 Tax=Hyaloperonospora arabidopsidis (strain Emoy2) TaxID=559515 RepID=M4BSW3_HYAAE
MQMRSLRCISKPTASSSEPMSTPSAPTNTSNTVDEEKMFLRKEHRGDVTTTSRGSDDGTAGDAHASTKHDVETPLAADAKDTTLASTTIIESSPETLMVSVRTMDDTMRIVDLAHDTASPADSDSTFEHELSLNSEGGSEDVSVKGPPSLDPATSPSEAQRAQRHANTHDLTMSEPRARKSPAAASATIVAAAEYTPVALIAGPLLDPVAENMNAIKTWVIARKRHAWLPELLLIIWGGLNVWILNCSTELTNLIRAIPYPLAFLEGMPRTSFLNFGHAINSETQLAVIRRYASDSSLSVRVCDHCNRWNTVSSAQKAVVRWRTTDSIKHWRRLEQLDKKLLCATITQQIEIPAWGALNAICALLPILAPADPDTAVVVSKTKDSLYFTSTAVRDAVAGVLSTPANWQPVYALHPSEERVLHRRD